MSKNRCGYLYLLNTVVLFSTYEVVSKTLVGKINPFQINFIRFLTGGLLLLLIVAIKRDLAISKRDAIYVVFLGIVNVVMSMNLLQLSIYSEGAKASVVAVIFSSNPIFVTFFSAILEKEKITLNKLAGLLIGFCGIVVIFFDKMDINFSEYRSPLLALLSAIFYGLYTVVGKKVSVRIGSLKMNSYSFIAGSIILLPILIFYDMPVLKFDYSGICQVLYLSLLVTGLAYLTYFKGLTILGSSKGSLIFFAKPVFASVIAVLFLKEQLSWHLIVGTILIIIGIVTVIYWNNIRERLILFTC